MKLWGGGRLKVADTARAGVEKSVLRILSSGLPSGA